MHSLRRHSGLAHRLQLLLGIDSASVEGREKLAAFCQTVLPSGLEDWPISQFPKIEMGGSRLKSGPCLTHIMCDDYKRGFAEK